MEEKEIEIECWKTKACGWRGRWDDLVSREPTKAEAKQMPKTSALGMMVNVCPKCGSRDFYRITD